jgi:hypothetical protein
MKKVRGGKFHGTLTVRDLQSVALKLECGICAVIITNQFVNHTSSLKKSKYHI